ncbi:hypothetical protein [Paenibacillus abyssi]|nr:hypothetical protein [Paenibacillus abyssi]
MERIEKDNVTFAKIAEEASMILAVLLSVAHTIRYHGELKYWLKRFDGVATRYLDNYLFWFGILELNKNQDEKTVSNAILLASCQKPNFNTILSFKTG